MLTHHSTTSVVDLTRSLVAWVSFGEGSTSSSLRVTSKTALFGLHSENHFSDF